MMGKNVFNTFDIYSYFDLVANLNVIILHALYKLT